MNSAAQQIYNYDEQISNTEYIHASSVDDTHIVFKCPCPKKCRTKFHRHGSEGNLLNRMTHRSSHCKNYDDYYLVIDGDTLRATQNNNGYVYKKSMKLYNKIYMRQLAHQQSKHHNQNVLTNDGKLNILIKNH